MVDTADNLVTSKVAAALIYPEMTVEAFRKAADRSPELQAARTKIANTVYLYDRERVIQWASKRKPRR